ncbi:MAG: undecaprenyl-phosphate glucose phosphotransferase [Bacteroides sp.]|nr:undecaprenyl-phosphate glucose phosphotransferase [Barnesiella sp.]MBD5314917.1 undecaprenyl-phosphate glucose phosphotransferase [Bacteroides sp.]MDE6248117.1 undecaprenyl-phosphate glucose phosphotransferase [Paramuribaculum sp.]MDE7448795.1 undecaprenyl-phosphate glucose phosphotransferase [Paramuribaculum sp.]
MAGVYQRGRYGRYLHILLGVADLVVLNIVFYMATFFDAALVADRPRTVWLLANLALLPITKWLQTSNNQRSLQMQYLISNTLKGLGLHALLFIVAMTFVGIDIEWWVYLKFYFTFLWIFLIWGIVSRLLVKRLRRSGYNFSRVAIMGTNPTALRLGHELNNDSAFGYKLLGYFGEKPKGEFPMEEYRGTIDQFADFVKLHKVDEIFCTLSGEKEEEIKHTIEVSDDNMVRFYYIPQLGRYVTRSFELSSIGPLPIMGVRHNPLTRMSNRILKRSFDIIFSTVCLICSPIIFIPVAIAIKLSSPGPIFFKQKRTGYKGKEFDCYKFRTMKVNSQADSMQATKDDPRKTRIGNFLRKTSIDELPQFINVLKGDMSVVGPRPHMLKHTAEYSALIDKYMVRHLVKPGITGWAQVNGFRGQTEELWQMEGRVAHDVWYIEHWTFFLDMKIIVRTVTNALKGEKNAF